MQTAVVELKKTRRTRCGMDMGDGLPSACVGVESGKPVRARRAPVLSARRREAPVNSNHCLACPFGMSGRWTIGGPLRDCHADWRHHAADHHRLPGWLAAVVCQGCPWRCRYCHNGHHLLPRGLNADIDWREVTGLLQRHLGLLSMRWCSPVVSRWCSETCRWQSASSALGFQGRSAHRRLLSERLR